MTLSGNGTIAVLIAGAVYLIAVLLFPDLVFAVIAKATDAIGSAVARIGAGYGALFVDLHALPRRKASMRAKIIGVLRKWWLRVHHAFERVIGRQLPRIRDLMQSSGNSTPSDTEV